jgi:queuine/archaeosine tRNA-ribosyltransferase
MGPEESMQIQSNLGSTIAMAFDECPNAKASRDYVAPSVERTTRWLQRCKDEMQRLNSLEDTINKEQLLTRFQKALEKEQGYARMSQNKLNGNFAQHAPANLVQEERDRLAESQRKIATLESYIKELQ